MKNCILSIILFVLATSNLSAQRLIVGTYTKNNLSEGIYVYGFNYQSGKATELNHVVAGNPSYFAIDKNNSYIYSVNESNDGKISSFKYDKVNGQLTLVNKQPNNGKSPCYISIDQTGKWLFSANYGDGSLSVHPISTDGTIGSIHQFIKHSGSSINKTRQAAPHVHCTYISSDNKSLYVPDLGLDKVFIYPFDATTGLLDTINKSAIQVPAGGGPRHIVFSKNEKFAYMVEEMSGNVNVILKADGKHTIIQTENHLPKDQEAAGADIHLSPDEKFLYVSQRSNSTIQIFKVDGKNGKIAFIAGQSTLGDFPRNFTIHPSGDYLLAANQKSNDITIFKRDKKTGLLTATGNSIKVGSPVCLLWIAEK